MDTRHCVFTLGEFSTKISFVIVSLPNDLKPYDIRSFDKLTMTASSCAEYARPYTLRAQKHFFNNVW